MCVEIPLYFAILFTSKFTDHGIAAIARMTKYQVFLNEETHSPERGEKEILILREFNSFLSIIKLHKKNNI